MKKIIKVLIVDDEPVNVQVMQQILSFHPQYHCKTACSGEVALKILKTYFPEIILLDVMMPGGMDGYEVCQRIRSEQGHKFAKIIMVSGMSMIDDRLKGYAAGADDYLTKPYVEDELLAKLSVYSKLNRMEELDALKTTAMNILSHETRTPLNGIILGSELLRQMEGLPEKAKQYVEMVRVSGARIQELVSKITRYYFIKDGIEKKLTRNSVNLIISSIISKLRGVYGPELVEVNYSCDENLALVADWDLLQEAFGYIIDNAFKNTPAPGVVTIDCRKENSVVVLQVADQGPGVEPSLAERMFDGLFISDLLHQRRGTGLSLAIAKEIIEEHGGRISCRNREDGGTLFEMTLHDQHPHEASR